LGDQQSCCEFKNKVNDYDNGVKNKIQKGIQVSKKEIGDELLLSGTSLKPHVSKAACN